MKYDIQGVTIPYLYFGAWRTFFAWHIEDRALWAINYLHFGKPKIWYGVPPSERMKVETVLSNNFPKQKAQCNEFSRHKSSFIMPKLFKRSGIKLYKSVQRANEIMITSPGAYHAGFNLGFNCAEAVNFATPSWLPISINAAPCTCGTMESSVSVDIEHIIKQMKIYAPKLFKEIPPMPKKYLSILNKQQEKLFKMMNNRKSIRIDTNLDFKKPLTTDNDNKYLNYNKKNDLRTNKQIRSDSGSNETSNQSRSGSNTSNRSNSNSSASGSRSRSSANLTGTNAKQNNTQIKPKRKRGRPRKHPKRFKIAQKDSKSKKYNIDKNNDTSEDPSQPPPQKKQKLMPVR